MILTFCLVVLLNGTAGLQLSPNDYMETYTHTENIVRHMAEDAFRIGNILLISDRNSLRSTDGTTTSLIVGSSTQYGYSEGVSDQARSYFITYFIQLTPANVLLVDYQNHCLRTVDRLKNATSTYIGSCGVSGDNDGTDALFYSPWAIIEDLKSPRHFFITELNGRALRYMAVSRRQKNVTTLFRGSLPYNNMVQQRTTGDVYITYYNGVAVYDYLSETMSNLAGSSSSGFVDGPLSVIRFNYPGGIIFLTNDLILIADAGNNRLRLLDLTTNTSSSICSGRAGGQDDGNLISCQLYEPSSLLIKDDTVYIGAFRKIRKIHGTSLTTTTGPPTDTTESTRYHKYTSSTSDETTTLELPIEEFLTTYDTKSTKGAVSTTPRTLNVPATTTEPPTEITDTTHTLDETSAAVLDETTTHKSTIREFLTTTFGTKTTKDVSTFQTTGRSVDTPILTDVHLAIISGTSILISLFVFVAYIIRLRMKANSATQKSPLTTIGLQAQNVPREEDVASSGQGDNQSDQEYTWLNQSLSVDHIYRKPRLLLPDIQPIAEGENNHLYSEINTYEEIDSDRPPNHQLVSHYYSESRF